MKEERMMGEFQTSNIKHQTSIVVLSLFILCLSYSLYAESDIRSVEVQFDRCESVMERVKREVLRFEQAVKRCRSRLYHNKSTLQRYTDDLLKLENRVDYFRSRIDRSFGQRDKIHNDLKNIKGATCPSCITSSVNLYCRNSENLTNELETYIYRAAALEDTLAAMTGAESDIRQQNVEKKSFTQRRKYIGESIDNTNKGVEECDSEAGKLLWKQCLIHLNRADSLHGAGHNEQAQKALDLVELLFGKAINRCNGQ